jgi:hypothetical protein
MRMKKALKIEVKAWKHKSGGIGVIGYKPFKTDGIEWVVCPIHNMAHPADFPCRGCLISDIINQTSG